MDSLLGQTLMAKLTKRKIDSPQQSASKPICQNTNFFYRSLCAHVRLGQFISHVIVAHYLAGHTTSNVDVASTKLWTQTRKANL